MHIRTLCDDLNSSGVGMLCRINDKHRVGVDWNGIVVAMANGWVDDCKIHLKFEERKNKERLCYWRVFKVQIIYNRDEQPQMNLKK
jgi:hypothetical protein